MESSPGRPRAAGRRRRRALVGGRRQHLLVLVVEPEEIHLFRTYQPIRGQYPEHAFTLDQSEASIQVMY